MSRELEKENQVKNISNERSDRLKKLEEIKKIGLEAYPAKTSRDFIVSDFLLKFDELEKEKRSVTLAGRLRAKRVHGNLAFVNLEDESASLQLVFSKKDLGDDSFKKFIKLIDLGDFLQVSGSAFLTHKEEKSLLVDNFKILGKSLRPIPDSWFGLKDNEDRFRHRYLDLLMNPEIKNIFYKKAKFWEVTRNFLKRNGFFEVETPTLEVTTGGAEANPFKTYHKDFDIPVYLRISIGELWQKRLMAAGYEKVFEIGRAYRNEGSSPDHLQEFTNMELYWAYSDYEKGMEFAKEMYREIAREVFGTTKFSTRGFEYDLSEDWPKIDYCQTVLEKTGINVLTASEEEMKKKLNELGVKYEGDNKERLTDTLWKYCRKTIAGPVFLINHPKLVSPLAKTKSDNPELTERFQIIIAGSEIGNGYSELNDPIDQANRFKAQQELIDRGDEEAMMPDWEFVEMLEYGMPPTFGFGFGERLFAFLCDKTIRETTLFPLMKPKFEDN